MDQATLKQWVSDARLQGEEDSDGFWLVVRGNLEVSVAYLASEDLVVCFAPLRELAGLEDDQRTEVLAQALALNGVGSLPPACALAYQEDGDVVYLLWQQSPEQLDSARFANAFADFETAAAQAQEQLNGLLTENDTPFGDTRERDLVIKA